MIGDMIREMIRAGDDVYCRAWHCILEFLLWPWQCRRPLTSLSSPSCTSLIVHRPCLHLVFAIPCCVLCTAYGSLWVNSLNAMPCLL